MVIFDEFLFLLDLNSFMWKIVLLKFIMCIWMHTNHWFGQNVHIWAKSQIWNSKSENGQRWQIWSIRSRTVRSLTADCPDYQVLDSPSQQWRLSDLSGHGPSAGPTWTVRDRQLTRPEAARNVTFTICYISLSTQAKKFSLVVCERMEIRIFLWTVREILLSSTTMSSSRYFNFSRISFEYTCSRVSLNWSLIWFWVDPSINWLVELLRIFFMNSVQNFELIWMGNHVRFVIGCFGAIWDSENHLWTVANCLQGWRRPSGHSCADCPAPYCGPSAPWQISTHSNSMLWSDILLTFGYFSHILHWFKWSQEEACRTLSVNAPSCRWCRLQSWHRFRGPILS